MKTTITGLTEQEVKQKQEAGQGQAMPQSITKTTAQIFFINYICLFDYLFISSQMSAKPYFMGSTGILHLR